MSLEQTVKSGSQYEDYDTTSNTYDGGRQPVGVQVILGALACAGRELQKSVNQLSALDAGCGTGNYCAALSPYVGTMEGLDYSEGMLEKARKKTQDLKNVKLQRGDITDMPFSPERFAGVTINQVLHHLSRPGKDFSQVEKVFREVHRVLVPNGVLVVNTCSHEQLQKSVWLKSVIPSARERSVSSVFALATRDELEAGLEQWKEKLESGEADKFIAEHEEQTKRLGMTISIVAYKLEVPILSRVFKHV